MGFSCSNDSGIWVTTQIVEASLDIDFDVLFADMCTADSLLQRMGRCYRNRQQDYCDNEPNVYVYETKEEDGSGYGTVYDKFLYDRSSEFLKKYNNNIFDENMKLEYIDNVYDTEALKNPIAVYMTRYREKSMRVAELFRGNTVKPRHKRISEVLIHIR